MNTYKQKEYVSRVNLKDTNSMIYKSLTEDNGKFRAHLNNSAAVKQKNQLPYTPQDLNILKQIVEECDKQPLPNDSFFIILGIYQDILTSHGIDYTKEKKLFDSILEISKTSGLTWVQKLNTALNKADYVDSIEIPPRIDIDDRQQAQYTFAAVTTNAVKERFLRKWRLKFLERNFWRDHNIQLAANNNRWNLLNRAFHCWLRKYKINEVSDVNALWLRDSLIIKTVFYRWKLIVMDNRRVAAALTSYNERILSSFISSWRTKSMQKTSNRKALEFYNQKLNRNYLYNWKANYLKKQLSLHTAYNRYDEILLKKVYKTWYFRTYEINSLRNYAYQCVKKSYLKWVERLRVSDQLLITATTYHNKRLKNKTLNLWMINCTYVYRSNVDADKFYEARLHQSILNSWRACLMLRREANNLLTKFDYRRKLFLFEEWKEKTILLEESSLVRDRKLAARTLHIWRLKARLIYSQSTKSELMMLKMFHIWKLERVLISVQNFRKENLLYRTLKIWFDKMKSKISVYGAKHKIIASLHASNILKCVLDLWIKKKLILRMAEMRAVQYRGMTISHTMLKTLIKNYELLKSRAVVATIFYDKSLLHSSFNAWRDSLCINKQEHYLMNLADQNYTRNMLRYALNTWISTFTAIQRYHEQEKIASLFYINNELRRVMLSWKCNFITRRTRRQNMLLSSYINSTNKKRLLFHFNKWANSYKMVRVGQQKADDFYSGILVANVQFSLGVWRDALDFILLNGDAGNNQYMNTLKTRYFLQWRSRNSLVREMTNNATFIQGVKDLHNQSKLYKLWTMKRFRLQTKFRDAEAFKERLYSNRFRVTWRLWMFKTYKSTQQKKLPFFKDIFSISLKQSPVKKSYPNIYGPANSSIPLPVDASRQTIFPVYRPVMTIPTLVADNDRTPSPVKDTPYGDSAIRMLNSRTRKIASILETPTRIKSIRPNTMSIEKRKQSSVNSVSLDFDNTSDNDGILRLRNSNNLWDYDTNVGPPAYDLSKLRISSSEGLVTTESKTALNNEQFTDKSSAFNGRILTGNGTIKISAKPQPVISSSDSEDDISDLSIYGKLGPSRFRNYYP